MLKAEDEIMAALRREGPLKPEAIRMSISGARRYLMSINTIYYRLQRMLKEGKLEQVGAGRYAILPAKKKERNHVFEKLFRSKNSEPSKDLGFTHDVDEEVSGLGLDDEDPWAK